MKTYDMIAIGFGKGGKTLAADMAGRGLKVAMIEQSEMMYGGTCINVGCIPTKTLVHLAKLAPRSAGAEERRRYYSGAVAAKNELTAMLREKNYHNLADSPNVDVYAGTGSFVGPNTVRVVSASGEEQLLRAPKIVIDTGAETVIPRINGVDGNPKVFTSTSIMELTELPDRLTIVGGGYIGLEFASMYASFGSSVTVLESHAELIAREDRDVAAEVRKVLEKKGVRFMMNAKVLEIVGASVRFEDTLVSEEYELEADAVLLATGRRPNTGALNLAAARVETDERGAIVVDGHLRTSNPAVWAVGDVKGGPQFTYISLDDYRIVRDDFLGVGLRNAGDRDPVVYSVFIDPPLSRIGMGEDEARLKGLDVKVGRLPVAAIPRARTLGETDGLFKVVVEAGTGRILGCTLFGPESSEVINVVSAAMKAGLDHGFLRDFVFTHPSMSEALNDLMKV